MRVGADFVLNLFAVLNVCVNIFIHIFNMCNLSAYIFYICVFKAEDLYRGLFLSVTWQNLF